MMDWDRIAKKWALFPGNPTRGVQEYDSQAYHRTVGMLDDLVVDLKAWVRNEIEKAISKTQEHGGTSHEFCCRQMAFGFADGKIKKNVDGIHMFSAHIVLPADQSSLPTYVRDRIKIDFCPFCGADLSRW